MEHIPVMLREVLESFPHIDEDMESLMMDATFGRGGHTKALMKAHPRLKVVALDWDEDAQRCAQRDFSDELDSGKMVFYRTSFSQFEKVIESNPLAQTGFDFILADLGVSSPQLDQPHRGFSFYQEGPLDMRMDQRVEVTAQDLINNQSDQELVEIFSTYGEVMRPQRVVRAIVQDRGSKPFTTTAQLAGLIERVEGWRKKGAHPATRYFQALRIAVNRELLDLEGALPKFLKALKPGGRLATISFHSLEDRCIKRTMQSWEPHQGKRLVRKVMKPSEEEIRANPRSRSAKLRVFEKNVQQE